MLELSLQSYIQTILGNYLLLLLLDDTGLISDGEVELGYDLVGALHLG